MTIRGIMSNTYRSLLSAVVFLSFFSPTLAVSEENTNSSSDITSYYCYLYGDDGLEQEYYCEHIIVSTAGQPVSEAFVCGLPEDPFTIPLDEVFPDGYMALACEHVDQEINESITFDECQDLLRTNNCDNPIKQAIPQELRTGVKDALRGFFK